MLEAALIAAAFLLGAIPTGALLARARGVDIRAVGSGNIGATNVTRTLGKKLGLLTLAADVAKGALPALAADHLLDAPAAVAGVGLAAVLGHVFTPFLRFQGGKGVATALGVFLALAPGPTGIAGAIWAAAFAVGRIAAVGSLLAVGALPLLLWALRAHPALVALAGAVFALLLYTHRANLGRLLRRREHRF